MSKEILIKDNQFILREVKEFPLANEDELIQACLREDDYSMTPIIHPPMQNWTKGYFTLLSPNRKTIYYFHKLKMFPLNGGIFRTYEHANISRIIFPSRDRPVISEEADEEMLSPEGFTNPNGINYKNRGPELQWNTDIACPYADFFICIPINLSEAYTDYADGTSDPVFFGVHKTSDLVKIPKFPNVFDHGTICTGNSYRRQIENTKTIHEAVAKLLMNLRTTPSNNDLLNDQEAFDRLVRYDPDGNQLPAYYDTLTGYTCTFEFILEFVKHYKEYSKNDR